MANELFNPFPGLRPFESHEAHLFFGRDGQSDELLRRLRRTRFLAVVGTSGSGKSSLMRAGLLPALHGGMMAKASVTWHVALMRPSADPIGNLAQALHATQLFQTEAALSNYQTSMLRASLSRSSLGLIETCRQAPLPANENLLLVVDQFEELFRFKVTPTGAASPARLGSDEAAVFVQLLLEATRQQELPIYIVLTMRSDFLGDCAQFQNLPEAINDGQYLIPRMTRDQRRAAITGPIGVAQGEITPRLVKRLLNDVGDNPDQLPILQHALMRSWDYWQAHRQDGEPLDLRHYEDIGGINAALSQHADEAYHELPDERSRKVAERTFKCLTEKGPDNREIRRPIKLGEICAVVEASEAEVSAVIERFRQPGRSFLMPPVGEALDAEKLVDISHESLIRNWKRLKDWVEDEFECAQIYKRLAETAQLYQQHKAGLWRDPDLSLAVQWQQEQKPSAAWARRYHSDFEASMNFLDQSQMNRDDEIAEKEAKRKRELKLIWIFVSVLSVALLITIVAGWYANEQRKIVSRIGVSEKTKIALDLLLVKPVDALEFAIAAAGQSLVEYEQVTIPVQASLNTAIEIARETNILESNASVHCLTVDPAGQYLVSDEYDEYLRKSRLRLWDFEGNSMDFQIEDTLNMGKIISLAISTDSKTIICADSHRIYLWDIKGKPKGQILNDQKTPITSIAVNPNGKLIASAYSNGSIKVWNWETLKEILAFAGNSSINSISFSPDGKLLASASNDTIIKLWEMLSGRCIATLYGHKNPVHAVAFSHNGKLLASANRGVKGGTDRSIGDPDLNRSNIKIWDLTTYKEIASSSYSSAIQALAFSADDLYIVSGNSDNTLQVWDINGNRIGTPFKGHTKSVNTVAFSPNGQTIFSSSLDGTVRFWDFANIPTGLTLKHKKRVNWATFDPFNKYLITENRNMQLWDITGRRIGKPFKTSGSIVIIKFSPDGQIIASGGDVLQLWKLNGDPIARPVKENGRVIWALDFSPDGRYLVSGGDDKRLILWDHKGNPAGPFFKGHRQKIWSVDFSPDGQHIVSGSADSTIRLWDTKGNPIGRAFVGHRGVVAAVVFMPDNKTIVSGGSDGVIRFWSLNGESIRQFKAHNGDINYLDCSLDGKYIASGGTDGLLRVWRPDGSPVLQFLAHEKQIFSVQFSHDGNYLVSASEDSTVRLWSSRLWSGDWQKALKTACDRLRYHPDFRNLNSDIALSACLTCEKYVWKQMVWSKNKASEPEYLNNNLWQPQTNLLRSGSKR